MASLAAWVALAWAAMLLGLLFTAVLRRRKQRLRSSAIASPSQPRVLLVRPCAGDEPGLQQRLQTLPLNVQAVRARVVIGLSSASDTAMEPARAAVEALRRQGLDARVHVVPPRGPNRKASIVAGLLERYGDEAEAMVSADSDVELAFVDLQTLVAELLADADCGAVWVPTVESSRTRRLGNRASVAVLSGSLHAFPLLSGVDPSGMVGKIFALRPHAAAQSGGASALVDYLGEDMELSRRLRNAGFTVRPSGLLGSAVAPARRFTETIARHARWMAVIRAQRPALLLTYPLFFFPTLPLVLLALPGLGSAPLVAAAAVLLGLGARLGITVAARHFAGGVPLPTTLIVDLLLADTVLAAAWLVALSRRTVTWRGRTLRIRRDGRLAVEGGLS